MIDVALPVPFTCPTRFTESLRYKAPLFAEKSFVTFARVSVYVPAAREIVSVPAVALAFNTASRKLQEEELSTLLTLLQALDMGEVGAGSSNRFGKNVGSGSGIITVGPASPAFTVSTPGRPSIFTRTAKAATATAPAGRLEITAGMKDRSPGCPFGCETTASVSSNALRTIRSSAS